MRAEGGRLVYELEPCVSCQGTGKAFGYIKCPVCNGTGRGSRGGKGGCKECRGTRRVLTDERVETCGRCGGSGRVMEDRHGWLPKALWQALTFEVVRKPKRRRSWAENWLGQGCFSVTNYGAHARLSDEKLVAEVRDGKSGGVQACKVADEDDRLCDRVLIITGKGGYSVVGVYDRKGA